MNSTPKPAPKIPSTKVPPPHTAREAGEKEERTIDEAVDESFPASDPPAIASPSSTAAVRQVAEEGRESPEPDTAKDDREQAEGRRKKP
jgi:hypothetical protein